MRWYMKIYDWMIEDLHLSGNELLVFAYWYSWVESGRECTETATAIAAKLGMTTRSYHYITAKLMSLDVDEMCKNFTSDKCKYFTSEMCKNFTSVVKNLHIRSEKFSHRKCKNFTSHTLNIHNNNKTTQDAPARAREEDVKKSAEEMRAESQPLFPGGSASQKKESSAAAADIPAIIMEAVVEFYRTRLHVVYVPDFREETSSRNELAAKVRYSMEAEGWHIDGDSVRTWWGEFLAAAYKSADQWQRDNFNIRTLNSQYQRFINQIHNGKQANSNAGQPASGGVSREFVERHLRQAGIAF